MRFAVALVLALACQLAHAAPPGPTTTDLPPPDLSPPGLTPEVAPATTDEPAVKSYWYQTLAADGLAITFVALAANGHGGDSDSLAKLGIGTYLLGAPLIHVSKGRPGRALGSLAMRVGLPFVGALIGSALEPTYKCYDEYDDCGPDGVSGEVVLGAVLGVVGASLIDATVLAKGDAPKAKAQPTWTPTARATHGGVALGLTGTF